MDRLLSVAKARVPGPSPTYTRAHLLLAFLTIGESGTIGRHALAERSELGEGAVRTVLKKLAELSYIRSSVSGCSLTEKGRRAWEGVRSIVGPIIDFEGSALTVGRNQSAVLVKGGARAVKDGIEQRDSAVRLGASGATTYVMQNGEFSVPGGSSDCERDFPSPVWSRLRKELRPGEGDAIVVCGSANKMTAKLGALEAALTLP